MESVDFPLTGIHHSHLVNAVCKASIKVPPSLNTGMLNDRKEGTEVDFSLNQTLKNYKRTNKIINTILFHTFL